MKKETNKFYVTEQDNKTMRIKIIGIYCNVAEAMSFMRFKNNSAPRVDSSPIFIYAVKSHDQMVSFFDHTLDTNPFGIDLPW